MGDILMMLEVVNIGIRLIHCFLLMLLLKDEVLVLNKRGLFFEVRLAMTCYIVYDDHLTPR